jgi:hypothetical protein
MPEKGQTHAKRLKDAEETLNTMVDQVNNLNKGVAKLIKDFYLTKEDFIKHTAEPGAHDAAFMPKKPRVPIGDDDS